MLNAECGMLNEREEKTVIDIERAMKLTRAADLLEAAKEAERSNCETDVIRELYRRYLNAAE